MEPIGIYSSHSPSDTLVCNRKCEIEGIPRVSFPTLDRQPVDIYIHETVRDNKLQVSEKLFRDPHLMGYTPKRANFCD
jgi:hypothetical protein